MLTRAVRLVALLCALSLTLVACEQKQDIDITVNPTVPSIPNPGTPTPTVTKVTILGPSTVTLTRVSTNGICVAPRQTFVAVVDGTGAYYNSAHFYLEEPSAGANLTQIPPLSSEFIPTTNDGTHTYKLYAKSGGQGYVRSNTITIVVTGNCGSTPQPPTTLLAISGNLALQVPGANCPSNTSQLSANKPVTWLSDNTVVATINSSGLVTARAVGTATVVATASNGEYATALVTVSACPTIPPTAVRTIALSPPSGSGQVGTSQPVSAICRENDNVVSCSPTWSSSATHLVGVNSTGLVSYNSAGTAQICASWSGVQACGSFTATAAPVPAPSCQISANPMSVAQGGSSVLTWTSTNATSVTSNFGNDELSGSKTVVLSETRTFTITCTGPGGSRSASVTVTVTGPNCPASISYLPTNGGGTTIAVNQTKGLRVQNWPSNTDCVPFWYVSDPSRAQINGADSLVIIDGVTYYGGINAVLKGIWVGTVNVCVQTSLVIPEVKQCQPWTVTPASENAMAFEDAPRLKHMNVAGVSQVYIPVIRW